jgi:hypothetical protein
MEQRRRLLRAIGVATLLVGLLAVAALAAGGRAPLDGDGAKGHGPPIVFWDYVFSTAAVLFALAIPLVAWMFWVSSLSSQRRRTGQRRDLLVLAYVALACAAVVGASRLLEDDPNAQEPRLPRVEAQRPSTADDEEQRAPEFRWLPLMIVAGAAVALVAYQGARARRGAALDPRSDEELVDELATLIEDTLDDLRREPDPRRAVISAYARMERVLAAFGVPRLPFEAPLEYLQRASPDLEHVPGAARLVFELTHLYERAKFSPHEIDVEMKEQAIATLESLRAELLAPA